MYNYKILDENGNILDSSEWEGAPTVHGYEEEISKLDLIYSDLDTSDGNEYYLSFVIHDLHNETTWSNLIRIGD